MKRSVERTSEILEMIFNEIEKVANEFDEETAGRVTQDLLTSFVASCVASAVTQHEMDPSLTDAERVKLTADLLTGVRRTLEESVGGGFNAGMSAIGGEPMTYVCVIQPVQAVSAGSSLH